MNKHEEELKDALSLFHYKLDVKRELYGRKSVRNVILKISEAEIVYKVLNQYESDDDKHRQDIHELYLQTVKLLKQLEATDKEHKLTLQLLDKANQIIDETEKSYQELQRDVKRFFELKIKNDMSIIEYKELSLLYDKLSNVGNE